MTPIRPMNMSTMMIIRPTVLSCGVRSIDIPAVDNAAHDSNSRLVVSIAGIATFSAMVLTNIAITDTIMTAKALLTEYPETRLPKISM